MKRNPYARPVKDLFRRLALINGTLQHLDIHLRMATDQVRDDVRSGRGNRWAAGVALVIRDLTEWPQDGWARYYSAAGYQRRGRQFLSVLRDLRALSSAWAVSQGFEEFERALKNDVAVFLWQHPADFGKAPWRQSKKGGQAPIKGQIRLYEDLVRDAFRGVQDLLPRVRRAVPGVKEAEQKNNRALSLVSWLKVAESIRHAHVHSGGVVASKALKEFSVTETEILSEDFSGRQRQDGYVLTLTRKQGHEALNRFAEYGQLVAKAMSDFDGVSWEMPSGGRV